MIQIRKPTINDETAVMDMCDELADENGHVPGGHGLNTHSSYADWLDTLMEIEQGVPVKKYVPAIQFIGFDGNRAIGVIQLRMELNDFLLNSGGHIGYTVRSSERRKGYGAEMLQQCVKYAGEHGLKQVLVTCDESNIASAKTIEKAGGVLEDMRNVDGVNKKRYWIDTKAT